jgi:hypothetical protein
MTGRYPSVTLNDSKRLLATVAAAFPKYQERNLSMTAKIWQVALGDISPRILNVALIKLLMTQRFFPTIAEIREAAENLSPKAHPSAEEAWGEVNRHLCRSGAPAYSDPLIVKAIEAIGWSTIASSENIGVERAHFLRFYETMLKKENDERNNRVALLLLECSSGIFLTKTNEEVSE